MGVLAPEMADGMGQEQDPGEAMEPDTGAFELLKSGGDYREGDRVHTAVIYTGMQKKIFSITGPKKSDGRQAVPAIGIEFLFIRIIFVLIIRDFLLQQAVIGKIHRQQPILKDDIVKG